MNVNYKLVNQLCFLILTSTLTACGSGGGDDAKKLECAAPKVVSSDLTSCVLPNTAPVISSVDSLTLSDDVQNGITVYSATATDVDGDSLVWSIQDPQNIFAIDAATGELTVSDNSNLDFSLTNYQITLTVTDNGSGALSSSMEINVTVTDSTNGVIQPSITPNAQQGIIYYQRVDDDYTGWILHAWNNAECNGYSDFADDVGSEWETGLAPTGQDDNYGVYWLFDTKEAAECANFIVHKGDTKDPSEGDQKLSLTDGRSAFVVSGVGVFDSPDKVTTDVPFAITDASAHWIDANTLVWNGTGDNVQLLFSADATLDENFNNNNTIPLTETTLTTEQKARIPHIATWSAFAIDKPLSEIKSLLTHQLVLASFDNNDDPLAATFVQTAKVLDDIYTNGTGDADEKTLGVVYNNDTQSVSVWAPTANTVKLNLYNDNKSLVSTEDMTLDTTTGIWSFTNPSSSDSLDRLYYTFTVNVYHPITKALETLTVTDPYSVNTSANGLYSQFVNLSDDDLKPAAWESHDIATLDEIEDAILLEGHIRDMSILDLTTTEANRGKYLAFTEQGTDSMDYLSSMAEAGVTHFHMLPANDIASIEENSADRIELTSTVAQLCAKNSTASVCSLSDKAQTLLAVMESFDPSTGDAQKLASELSGYDGFNWGYDPQHFNVVEGSYASEADGVAKVKEFRQMVQALHEKGLRVALDVVYNHTSSSGVWDKSVFDKLVPGYYHRYSEVTGEIERSSCCENTATEHKMMAKFVQESLVHWAKEYKIDSFRFDIMGLMPKDLLVSSRAAVQAIDPDTYFYGEGWNIGETANGRLFEDASQYNMAGTEIGTYNDRPRDTIREAALSADTVDLNKVDYVRLGLVGTQQDYKLEDSSGQVKQALNFGQSSYAKDPADIINYISKHDGETLWDKLQYSLPTNMLAEQRVRVHSLSAAIPVLSQGIPFFQVGIDLLRSKSMDRNTYNSGDWFNKIDFTKMSNNWNIGLPMQQDNSDWDTIGAISGNANTAVTASNIALSEQVFKEFVKIRSTSKLFRLNDSAQISRRIGFHNTGASQTPGVIVMSIDDGVGVTDLDANYDAIVVVINGTDADVTHAVTSATGFTLHPIQVNSADNQLTNASFTSNETQGTFSVPAYTAAVFVKTQSGAQGTGLAADPDFVNSPFTDTPIYISALGNNTELAQMTYDDRGSYKVSQTLSSGDYEFNLGDSEFTNINVQMSDVDVTGSEITISQGDNESFAFSIETSGSYQFELEVSEATYVLKITLLNSLVSCEIPTSAGTGPLTVAGDGSLYVKGDHSGWGADAKYKLTYIGDNQYQAIADFDGDIQFKLASSDGDWATQLWANKTDGTIETSALSLGTNYNVSLGNAGTDNNKATLTKGTYKFLLSLNEDDPQAGADVGTLNIQQCSE